MDCYVLDDGLSHDDDTRYATALRRSARIEICDPRDGEDFPFPVSRYALPYNWTVGLS